MTAIIGSGGGGGKGGGGGSRTPKTTPDSLDSRQYATVVDLISEGEIEGLVDGNKSIFLNDTALENDEGEPNFEDVTIYQRNGTQIQPYIPIITGAENTRSVGRAVTKFTSVTETINDPTVDAARVTISIGSLQKIDNKTGDTKGSKVQLKIFIAYAGAVHGDAVIDDTISGRTADLYQKDYLLTLNRPNQNDSVNIKVERITEDSEDSLLSNSFSWSSLVEIKYAKLAYPNSALIALRVDSEQFNSIPTRKYLIKGVKVAIPTGVTVDSNTGRIIYPDDFIWNGTFSDASTWCSCPAFILWDLLTNTRYGFGNHIDVAQLDKYAFFAASKYSNALVDDGFGGQEARFSCNTTIQTAEESFKLVNDLLSVMRCQGFWAAGSLTIEQDAPKDAAYLFTIANVTQEGFGYSGSSLKTRPTVVVVSYLDLGLQDTAYEVVEDHDGIAKYGVVRKEFSAFACTSRGQAARIGKWILYSEKFEKEVVTFVSGLEAGQVVRPGTIIQIADPVASGFRKGGRIKAATSNTITVDDTSNTDLTYGPGSFLYVILPDGTVDGEVADEKLRVTDITNGVITVDRNFAAIPNVNSVWVLETLGLGENDIQPTTWRVISVEEQEGMLYAISAIAYNASKYGFVEDGEALQTRDTTNLDIIPKPPENLKVLETLPPGETIPQKEVQFVLNGRVAIKITWHWRVPEGQVTKKFRIRYRHEDDNFIEVVSQGTTFDILDAKEGTYHIQVSSISSTGVLFSKPVTAFYPVEGLKTAPSNIRDLSLVPTTDTLAILSWKKIQELDVQLGGRIIIRHDPRPLASAEWTSSNQIVDGVSGASTQKQVPLLAGTYFVKAEDYLGNKSTVETAFEASLPVSDGRYLAKTYAEHTTFLGTKTNCSVVSGNLNLVPDLYVALGYVEDFYAIGDGEAEYIFQDTFDFGVNLDFTARRNIVSSPLPIAGALFDSRSGLFDDAAGLFDGSVSDSVNVATYIRTAATASPVEADYTPWAEFISAVIQGRHVQIKAILNTTDALTSVSVDQLGATLELMRRTETGSGTSGSAVTFTNAFHQVPEIMITPTDLGTDGHITITKSATGFTATLSNADNSGFSYTATGFGRAL